MGITVKVKRNRIPLLDIRVRGNSEKVTRNAAALTYSLAVAFAPIDTGALKASGQIIQEGLAKYVVRFGGTGGGGRVDYAEYIEFGTGLYGPQRKVIVPKNGKYLVFEINGKKIFATSIKGSKPQPFVGPALAIVSPRFRDECRRSVVKY